MQNIYYSSQHQPCLLLHKAFFSSTDPPEITIRPRNLQVRANGIAAFYCAARGDPIPNIQWRKNGKRVSSKYLYYTKLLKKKRANMHIRGNDKAFRKIIDIKKSSWGNIASHPRKTAVLLYTTRTHTFW